MSPYDIVIAALSAIVLFLYGLQSFSTELQAVGGSALRDWLPRVTANRWQGFLLGAVATAIVQSSTAITSLAVALVDAGVIGFGGSLGVLLGANVGTTATAWMVSMKLTGIGPVFIIAGTIVSALPWRLNAIGKAVFYFGLIFFALDLIGGALKPLQHEAWFTEALTQARTTWMAVAIGLVFTLLVQSSTVTTGLAIVLAQQGLLPVESAIGIVVGANVGSTSTALLSSLRMSAAARATGIANFVFNATGGVLFFPLIVPLARLLEGAMDAATMVAASHLLFNLGITLLFLPLLPRLQPVLQRWAGVASAPDRQAT